MIKTKALKIKTHTQKTHKKGKAKKKSLFNISFLSITDFLSSLFDKVFCPFKILKYLLVLYEHY